LLATREAKEYNQEVLVERIDLDGPSHISDLKYRLMTIELLNLAKNYYTYRELSQITGLPDTVLSRYVKGHVLPTTDRALYIGRTMQKVMPLEKEIQLRIRFDDSGYFDDTRLISDPLLLERAVQHAVNKFAGTRITKILSPAVNGLPLAAILAHRLGVHLVIAKNTREVGVSAFFEEIYIPGRSAMVLSLYVPRDALRRGDCVLIVDDVLDTGEKQMALAKIVQRAKAEVTGVYALISLYTDGETKMAHALHCPVEIVHQIGEKPLQRA
jgi:adenine/guanine phosphoribosyltransferase-like PRPP-binding protein